MTTTLDRTSRRTPKSAVAETQPAQRLRMNFAAVRVSFTWLGVRKSLNAEQKSQAAESFGAEGQYLSAAKKLLDTKHSAFAAVTSMRSQIISYWKGLSLPYPEPGIRLIKQNEIESFNKHLTEYGCCGRPIGAGSGCRRRILTRLTEIKDISAWANSRLAVDLKNRTEAQECRYSR